MTRSRGRLLTTAVASAVVLLAVSPATGATARSISLAVPTTAVSGTFATITGALSHSAVGSLVTVQQASGHSWTAVASAYTNDTHGHYSTVIHITGYGSRTYRAVAPAALGRARAVSATRALAAEHAVTATGQLAYDQAVGTTGFTITGKVKPFKAGTTVTLQRSIAGGASGAYTTVPGVSAKVGASGSYVLRGALATGEYYYRAAVAEVRSKWYAPATSPTTLVDAVDPDKIATRILTPGLADATLGKPYSQALHVTLDRAGAWSLVSGALPAGLSLQGGSIVGTPTTAQTEQFTLGFTDTEQRHDEKTLAISVLDPAAQPLTWSAVALGGTAACGLDPSRALLCWGEPIAVSPVAASARPVATGAGAWRKVSVGSSTLACAIAADGTLWCWGSSTAPNATEPAQVGTDTWSDVAVSGQSVCAVRETDATLWCWGDNASGQLGLGDTKGRGSPTQVGAGRWSSVAMGADTTCAVAAGGTLWCWGDNLMGQLGLGDRVDRVGPQQVGTSAGWASVDVGSDHTCALRSDDSLWCWGDGFAGAVGDGGQSIRSTPVRVGAATWASVATGGDHTCAVTPAGALWCWGANGHGQLGIGYDNSNQMAPTRVGSGSAWTGVSAAGSSTCATRSDASLWCWGGNSASQLGLGHAVDRWVPTEVVKP